jgi:hypothetical protein
MEQEFCMSVTWFTAFYVGATIFVVVTKKINTCGMNSPRISAEPKRP